MIKLNYYAHGEALPPFKLDRIRYEGTFSTFTTLIQLVSPDDPNLQFLATRWQFPFTSGSILL